MIVGLKYMLQAKMNRVTYPHHTNPNYMDVSKCMAGKVLSSPHEVELTLTVPSEEMQLDNHHQSPPAPSDPVWS